MRQWAAGEGRWCRASRRGEAGKQWWRGALEASRARDAIQVVFHARALESAGGTQVTTLLAGRAEGDETKGGKKGRFKPRSGKA